MSIEEKYELFEAYLDNSLNEDEQILFDTLMQDDVNKKEFEEYKNIQVQLAHVMNSEKDEKAFVQNVKNISASFKDEKLNERESTNKPTWQISTNTKWILSAAAVLLFGLFIGQQYFNTPTGMRELYATNYTPEELSIERGTNDDSLTAIAKLYNAHQYKEAIPLMQQFMTTHAENINLKIHLAICMMEIQDYPNAEQTLKNVIAENNLYKEKAQWYLAMLYLKQENKKELKALIHQFDKNHFYYKKGKEILNEME